MRHGSLQQKHIYTAEISHFKHTKDNKNEEGFLLIFESISCSSFDQKLIHVLDMTHKQAQKLYMRT